MNIQHQEAEIRVSSVFLQKLHLPQTYIILHRWELISMITRKRSELTEQLKPFVHTTCMICHSQKLSFRTIRNDNLELEVVAYIWSSW